MTISPSISGISRYLPIKDSFRTNRLPLSPCVILLLSLRASRAVMSGLPQGYRVQFNRHTP